MVAIMLEGVFSVAAIVAVAALLFIVLKTYTPLGLRLRQAENRKRIEREAGTICAVHGAHRDVDMVLLAGGDRICPDCFREAVRDSML